MRPTAMLDFAAIAKGTEVAEEKEVLFVPVVRVTKDDLVDIS